MIRIVQIAVLIVIITQVNCKCLRPSLLIVSFDGFRHDYFSKNVSYNMIKLRSEGTYADHMTNVFPTKTFPNHHSIATGVYPEVHGVLNSEVFDPDLGRKLKFDEMWNYNKDLVPIWNLNEVSGDDCVSGSVMWPGSDQVYQQRRPTYLMPWNTTVPWKLRVDTFITWFLNPSRPANLVMAYFEEPDYLSHRYGPDSEQVLNQISVVDTITKYIHDQLREKQLGHVNVMLLSDHGMIGVNKTHILDTNKNVDNSTFKVFGTSPIYNIWPNDLNDSAAETTLYNAMSAQAKQNGHYTILRKKDIPESWHLKNNARTSPIIALANPGYAFQDLLTWKVANYTVNNMTWGVHGYSNNASAMWPFFMAWGPSIKVNHKVANFNTVDLYSLFTELLHLRAPPNNGSLAAVKDVIRTKEEPMSLGAVIGITIFVLSIIIIGLIIAFLMRRADLKRPRRNTEYDADPKRMKPEDNSLLDPVLKEEQTEIA